MTLRGDLFSECLCSVGTELQGALERPSDSFSKLAPREQNTAKGKYVRASYSNANESGFWLPYFFWVVKWNV